MLTRRLGFLVILWTVTLSGAGCTGGSGTAADTASAVEDRTFALKLTPTALRVAFLTAELTDLSVVERVRKGSGEVVEAPKLRGMLKVKNTSNDRSARLVGGTIEYLGAEGRPIALAPGRGDAAFTFYTYSGDRVDPGKDTSQAITVPFPAAAVNAKQLAEVRLTLTYIPAPYRTEAATASASLMAQGQSQ